MVWDLMACKEKNIEIKLSKRNNLEDVEWIELFHTGVRMSVFPTST